jgi:hypothetical protein
MDGLNSVDLYNFDHGIKAAGTYRFGPYELSISQEDVTALDELVSHPWTHFTHDENNQRVVQKNEARRGRLAKTASVRLVDPLPHAANILRAGTGQDGYADLAILLSFLTGRRVYLDSHLTGKEGAQYGDFVVAKNYFYNVGLFWPDLTAIADQGLVPALWAVVNAKQSPDLIGAMLYASSAFDSGSSQWFNNNIPKNTPAEREAFRVARLKIDKAILETIGDEEKAKDYSAKSGNIFQPSAVFKIKAFLEAKGLLDAGNDDALGRVKLVNRVRNLVVHNADVPSDIHPDEEMRVQIAAYVAAVTLEIISLHIADVAGIKNFQIDFAKDELRTFFQTSEFRKHKLFDETYEEFQDRVDQEWLSPPARTAN